jgi:hypothetical protein
MLTLEEVIERYPLPLPAPLTGTMVLEQMQKEDIVKAAGWRRALLDLPVGYGKTVIVTCISLMLQPEVTVVLVPPILIPQWVSWISSIRGAGRALAFAGSPKQRAEMALNGVSWLVMSYQVFNNDIARLRKDLAKIDVMLAVDEAQNLKGRGVLYKNVRTFAAGRDLMLASGTIMSKPGDAYAYIALNTPDVYPSYNRFENIHVKERHPIFKQPTEWHNMDLLQANLSMRRVYRSDEEVHAALPKPRFIPIYYDLSKDHMALYKRLMEEQLLALDDGSKIDATTATRLYHAAQQIITNYGFFAGDETKRSAVFDLADAVMDEIGLGDEGRSKLIFWTIYKRTSAAVHAHVNQYLAGRKDGTYGVAAYSDANSKKSIEQFMTDPLAAGLTAQPGSAGAGLNPQYICKECAYFEFPTTTIPFKQSYGRIHRKGQRFNPNIRMFIARGTIQEQLLKSLFDNDNLVQKASGSRQGIKSLIFP